MSATLTPEAHRRQIEAYTRVRSDYETFAAALRRILEASCAGSLPEAIIQVRAKQVASFAEKCARKFSQYPDPVNQFTDLCGARVIVQTLEQVEAVCEFVAANFRVVERDDKSSRLSTDKFGYRDMHFIIEVKPERPFDLSADEWRVIRDRKAELQVRTWVQHAWADTLHDRIYKAPLRLSTEIKRAGSLLAAVMEEGDRGFDQLAGDLDGMLANYTAYAAPVDVEREIGIQRLLLTNAQDATRPGIALKLARLIATRGEWNEAIALLAPYAGSGGLLGLQVSSELGHALCRLHRNNPQVSAYQRGQEHLLAVARASSQPDRSAVPDLRRVRCVHARALARLGWTYEALEADAHEARRCYAGAVELEPTNPYYLADMLGFELRFAQDAGLLGSFRSTIRGALRSCQEHAESGTELPAAFFAAGRLQLLLGEFETALNAYARGLRFCRGNGGMLFRDTLETEIAWLHRVNPGNPLPEKFQWAKDLLVLGMSQFTGGRVAETPPLAAASHADRWMIIAGGAAGLRLEQVPDIQTLLKEALTDFQGVVISGGTTSGIPGSVGHVAQELAAAGAKKFRLRGYVPKALPEDAERDKRYDEIISCGAERFTPAQVLCCWKDVLAAGIDPRAVLLLGFGGGPISAFEYRLALALGVTVGIVIGSGDAADALLNDPLWSSVPELFPLPADAKTLRSFAAPDESALPPELLDKMAKEFHARFLAGSFHKIRPESLKPWDHLAPTYVRANREQAAAAIRILEGAGFHVQGVKGEPVAFANFSPAEIELMAELEHGRWIVERLRDGWRPGPRDDEKKLHNLLVPWKDLPDGLDGVKRYDRAAVAAFPEILAKAGLEVVRKRNPDPVRMTQ